MARAKTPRTSTKILQSENKKLAEENARLRRELAASRSKTSQKRHHFWRTAAVVVCAGIAGALLVAGNVFFWAGRTVTDTGRYIQTVGPLIENTQVQQGIAAYATNKLYEEVNVEQILQEALPPRASALAPSLSGQLKTYTQSTIEKILANPEFQQLWIESQTRAHSRIISIATNYEGDGTIDINDIYQRISERLADTRLSFLSGKQLPANVGSITVIEAKRLPAFHTFVTNIGLWQTLATLALIIFTTLAVWLSKNRRRTAMLLGWMFAVLMFITLIAIRLTIRNISSGADPAYESAVEEAGKIILNSLRIQTITLMLLGLFVAVVAWLSSSSRAAIAARGRIQTLLSGNVHRTLFPKKNGFTRWMGTHRVQLQWLAVAITGIIFFFMTLTPAAIIIGALLLLLVILSIYILSEQ